MYAFDFVKPTTVEEAVTALAAEEAQALGGGQTLIPTLKQRLASPGTLVSLTGIAALKGVAMTGGRARASAAAPPTRAVAREAAAHYPALAALARPHRRPGGAATAAPSAAASPTTTLPPTIPAAALASGATIVTNAREIAADDYFQGMFTTALEPGEIITEVRFPVPERANYQKFLQPASRFALVGVFVAKFADGVRVAVTGASEDGVFRWTEAEAALSADFRPEAVTDLKASADGHDRRPARHAGVPRAPDRRADETRGGGRLTPPLAPAPCGRLRGATLALTTNPSVKKWQATFQPPSSRFPATSESPVNLWRNRGSHLEPEPFSRIRTTRPAAPPGGRPA